MTKNENKVDDRVYSDDDVVVLQGEDGKEVEFVVIADLDYGDSEYCILQPVELGDMDDCEVLIFELVKDENGADIYQPVEDRDLAQEVLDEFYRLVEESEEEEDGCGCNCSSCGHSCSCGDDCECDDDCDCDGSDCSCKD